MQLKKNQIISIGIIIAFFYLLYDYVYPKRLISHAPLIYILVFTFIIINVKDSLEWKKFFGILGILFIIYAIILAFSNSIIPLELNSEEGITITFLVPLVVIIITIITIKAYNIIIKNKTDIKKLIKKIKTQKLKFFFPDKPK